MTQGWLAQLAPGHPPPAPAWWPPAPGWWGVAALFVAATAAFVWWWRRDPYRRRRRIALRELSRIGTSETDPPAAAQAIENVLRRFAIAVFGGDRVARLGGDAWLAFMGEQGGESLSGPTGRSLLAAAFGGRPEDHRERWLSAASAFVRAARRRAPDDDVRAPTRKAA